MDWSMQRQEHPHHATMRAMEPDIAIATETDSIRLFPRKPLRGFAGVTYSLAMFRALAERLPAGTRVDILRRDDGTITLYHYRPGPTSRATSA